MKIYENYPTFQSFKQNEFKTLEYIYRWGFFSSQFQDLNDYLKNRFFYYKNTNFESSPFEIHVDFHMEVERSIHKVIIGANILGEANINSYFLALCSEDDKEIIRKFHFDYALPTINTNQKVPTFHLQYGGKPTGQMREQGLDNNKLDSWLSVPRLNFVPINLAILFDILLCEFHSRETETIYESQEWRTLILNNEKFLYSHYFNNISEHINSHHYTNKHLLRDLYYGK